jgi:hypothetical protein
MSRVLGPQALEAYADMLRHVPTDPALGEFDDLPADADADTETRRALAERFVPFVRTMFTDRPRLQDMSADAPGGARFANRTAATALRELYNPAQLDVLDRAHRLLRTPPGRERPGFHLRALPPEPLGSGSYCRWTDSGSDLSATTISVARAVPRANESSQLCAAWPRRGG